MIYLDNAGTTKVSKKVKKAMMPYLDKFFGNASSLHSVGQTARTKLDEARAMIAKSINAQPEEIYFTSGGTESDNWAIESACWLGKIKGKNHIITSAFEHHAVLNKLQEMEKAGFEVSYLPVYKNGIVKVSDLKKAITDKTCLVTIMFANNEIGTIQPIAEIGKICRKNNIIFHTDAVQAVGHTPVDVEKMNIDMLSMSAHKFHGPKGVGALYVKKNIPLKNLMHGGAQEKNRRPGTENLAGCMGMAVALADAVKNMERANKKIAKMRDMLFDSLSSIPHSVINGDRTNRLANNFNMCFEGIEGESLLLLLNDAGICASSGSACTSGSLDPSHVLLAIGLPHEVAHGSLRLTLGEDNSVGQIKYTIKQVKKIVEYLRKISPVWDSLEKGDKKHVI